jgi:perosamine synthetase
VIRIPSFRPALGPAELDAVRRVFDRGWLSVGEVTAEFERALEARLGATHVIGVASGTAALHLALEAVGVGDGDEVVLPSLTFAAAPQMVRAIGAVPVFCDVDARTLSADPADVERRLTARTRVIMPMHYGGYACDMPRLEALARRHHLTLLDDAAHAFGSRSGDRTIGTIGDATCFSFSPVKTITCGEGGAVATSRDDIAAEVRRRRNLGIDASAWSRHEFARPWQYAVASPGYRYALPNLNAAIGLVQLARVDEFQRCKQAATRRYDTALASTRGLATFERDLPAACPYSYTIRVLDGRRDALIAHLRARGIGTAVHYVPNHLQPAFAAFRTSLPVTERLFDEILTLPLSNTITEADTTAVIEAVQEFCR